MNSTGKSILIGTSNAVCRVLQQIRQVAPSDAPVLICGEKGSGRNLVAELIHQESNRRDRAFIKLRCCEMSANLLEQELFGHERGAIPGAVNGRKGWLETARGGTVFLDEIASLSPSVQIKLLRVLQEHEIERLGSSRALNVDIRFLAATQHPMEHLVRNQAFREDLWYRLTVFPIQIPPLRERKSDIPALVVHFLAKHAQTYGKTARNVSEPAMDLLVSHSWPGNVRELEECIERAILASDDDSIHIHHLSLSAQPDDDGNGQPLWNLGIVVSHVEREMITDALKSCAGNMTAAARKLGLTKRMMEVRIHKHGIELDHFKPHHALG
jgi:Nif-specific regulatory protein